MKLMDLFSKLTPAEFAKIHEWLLQKDISEELELFLEKICSDDVLNVWRKNNWTLDQMLLFYQQGILNVDREALLKISPPKSEKKTAARGERFAASLASDSTSEKTASKRFDTVLNLSITRDSQQSVGFSIVKKVSFAAEAESAESNAAEAESAESNAAEAESAESKPISCFKEEQLQQLDRKTRRALKKSFVVKAIEDKVITKEDFLFIFKLKAHSWAIDYLFSEKGIEDIRYGKITLEQLANIPCRDYLEGLLSDHAQEAIKKGYISINFISRIWFRLRYEKVDKKLVSMLLSPKFLTFFAQNKFDLMGLFYKSYHNIYESLYFEKCIDGCYDDKTDFILRTFLLVWLEGLEIFCSDNAQRFFTESLAQPRFFNRLLCLYEKERAPIQIVFEKLDGLKLAFSHEGYWAISQKYLKFSNCDDYASNVIKRYIWQLKNNAALRDVIQNGELAPEVILDCYIVRFQLGCESSFDELSWEQYPGEYFDFFTTPVALQAFKENSIYLDTKKYRKDAIELIRKRDRYIKELEAYIYTKNQVIKEYRTKPYLLNAAKEEENKACFAGKICNQLQGINTVFTKEDLKVPHIAEMVSIFDSVDELKGIIRTANTRSSMASSPTAIRQKKPAHPLDGIYCKPNASCSPHALGSRNALFQSQRDFPIEDESQKPSNDIKDTDANFDVFSVALGSGPVP